jgi:prevent-host-death family protein
MKVSVAEARNTFTKLLQAVENGERVTICRNGKPVADIVPHREKRAEPRSTELYKVKLLSSTRIGGSRRRTSKRGCAAMCERTPALGLDEYKGLRLIRA